MIARLIERFGMAELLKYAAVACLALTVLLTGSVAVNLWQLYRSGQAASAAKAACDERIAAMVAEVDRKTAAREVTALEIGRETTDRAEAASAEIQRETIRYVDRIREVRVEVPAACHAPMPERVRDTLADAARAADSFVRAR